MCIKLLTGKSYRKNFHTYKTTIFYFSIWDFFETLQSRKSSVDLITFVSISLACTILHCECTSHLRPTKSIHKSIYERKPFTYQPSHFLAFSTINQSKHRCRRIVALGNIRGQIRWHKCRRRKRPPERPLKKQNKRKRPLRELEAESWRRQEGLFPSRGDSESRQVFALEDIGRTPRKYLLR